MVMAITFDTLKFVKKLTEAGIPQKQAEAQAEAFKEAHEENIDSLATKQDLTELKIDLIEWVLSIVFTVSTAQAAVLYYKIYKLISALSPSSLANS